MSSLAINSNFSDVQHPSNTVLSVESEDILKKLKNINTGYFFKPDGVLFDKLKGIEVTQFTHLLERLFAEMVEEDRIADPIKFLDRLSSVTPLEKLQEAFKDDVPDLLKEAQQMFEEAKHYLQMTNGNTSPTLRACLSSILDGIISVIDSIITAFGIGDFFKPAESDIHADFKSNKIMMLLGLFSMLTSMILPILAAVGAVTVVGAAVGSLVIGGTLLGIAALSVIWPFIRPSTTHLPGNAENWTKQVQKGGFIAQGRKESLDKISDIIKMNRHAILVGPSRVGKSLTAKAFAQAIERGDYPELKGKVVFRINTSDLVDQKASFLGGGNNILNKISAAMGRHRNDIILVLDEIHMACKNKAKIADQLKTFLDENGEFPHVIGITTKGEYKTHVKNNLAFSLRFSKVEIENMNQDETLEVLSDTILRSRSKPIIKESTLKQIYDKSCKVKDAPQPSASLELLMRCINMTGVTQKSVTEKKIIEVSTKIRSLRSQAAASRGRKKEARLQIAVLEDEMRKLQEAVCKEKKEIDRLFKSKELLDRVTKETYSLVLRISGIAQKTLNSKTEKQLKMFVFLSEFLSRSLESHVEQKAKTLGIKAVIDEELIDKVASKQVKVPA